MQRKVFRVRQVTPEVGYRGRRSGVQVVLHRRILSVTSVPGHRAARLHPQGQWYFRYQMVSFFNCGPKRGLSCARIAISQLKFMGEQKQRAVKLARVQPFSSMMQKPCQVNVSVVHSDQAFTYTLFSWEQKIFPKLLFSSFETIHKAGRLHHS